MKWLICFLSMGSTCFASPCEIAQQAAAASCIQKCTLLGSGVSDAANSIPPACGHGVSMNHPLCETAIQTCVAGCQDVIHKWATYCAQSTGTCAQAQKMATSTCQAQTCSQYSGLAGFNSTAFPGQLEKLSLCKGGCGLPDQAWREFCKPIADANPAPSLPSFLSPSYAPKLPWEKT